MNQQATARIEIWIHRHARRTFALSGAIGLAVFTALLLLFTPSAGAVVDEAPDTTISAPASGSQLTGSAVTITGTASDDVGVGEVLIAIRDRNQGLWWDPSTSSFGSAFKRFPAVLAIPDAPSTEWTLDVDFGANGGSGSYFVSAIAWDSANRRDPQPATTVFTLGVVDAEPETVFDSPEVDDSVEGPIVSLAGSASDDVGVADVQIAVQDRVSRLWWDPSTSSFGPFRRFEIGVVNPGATSTTWVADISLGASSGSGDYFVAARAVDTAGNFDRTQASTRFTVTPPTDLDPETVIDIPATGTSQPGPIVSLAGTATDDTSVTAVEIAIQDRTTGLWWNPTTTTYETTITYIDVTLDTPDTTTTTWILDVDFDATNGSGMFLVTARAIDNNGNIDQTNATTTFDIDPPTELIYVGDFAGPAQSEITPVDVAATSTHLYILDVARYRIARVVRSTGVVDATVGGARSMEPGMLAAARSIALDSAGNVYIADTPNRRVTKFDADLNYIGDFGGNGSTLGTFFQVYGLAIGQGRQSDGSLGEIVYTVDGDGRITRWGTDGTVIGTFAVNTSFNQPRMAEVHPTTNDLWVVNARARQVIVFDVDGTERFRFGEAGTGPGQLRGDPRGIAISADGSEVFVSDEGNHRIQVFDQSGNYLREIGGNTPGTPEYLVDARGLEITADDTLVVSDEWDFSMKEFNPSTGALDRKLFGAGPPVGGVNVPRGLAVDPSGRVFVSDWWNQRIQRWESDGSGPFVWGFRGTVNEPGSVNFAWDVAVQPGTNRIFLANRESHEIEVFEDDGTYVNRFGTRGTANGQMEFPHGVDFGPDGDLWVTDSGGDRVIRFSIDASGDGTFVANYGSTGDGVGQLDLPTGIAVEANGLVWVADVNNHRFQRLDPTTGVWTIFTKPIGGSQYQRPRGVTVAPDGTLWIADSGKARIVNIDNQGNQLAVATGVDMGAGPLLQPFDVEVLSSGNLIVSDMFNNRIIEVEVN